MKNQGFSKPFAVAKLILLTSRDALVCKSKLRLFQFAFLGSNNSATALSNFENVRRKIVAHVQTFWFFPLSKIEKPDGNRPQAMPTVYSSSNLGVFGAHPHTPLHLVAASRRHELTCGQDTACRGGCAKENSRRPTVTTAAKYVSFTSGHNQFPNLL